MSKKVTNLSEYITENFGANASYVEGLLNRYQSDPNLVDESWRQFFGDLINGNVPTENRQSTAATSEKTTNETPKASSATKKAETVKAATEPTKTTPTVNVGADVEVTAITGVAKKSSRIWKRV